MHQKILKDFFGPISNVRYSDFVIIYQSFIINEILRTLVPKINFYVCFISVLKLQSVQWVKTPIIWWCQILKIEQISQTKSTLAVGVEPAVEWLVLFEKYVPSWESDNTEWLESSPMALTEVSEHAA